MYRSERERQTIKKKIEANHNGVVCSEVVKQAPSIPIKLFANAIELLFGSAHDIV